MKVIKTVITVFIAIMSLFICLLAAVIFFSETDYLKYEAEGYIQPVIISAETEYLGDEYNGESESGFSYYRLYVTIQNNSNYNYNTGSMYLYYDSSSYAENEWERYNIVPVEDEFVEYDETGCIPAGKEATYSEVLCIEDGCKGFVVTYNNYRTDSKQTVEIDL